MSNFDLGLADGIAKSAAETRGAAARELAGLALIAAPVAHGMVQRARGKKLTHRQEQVHGASDIAGLSLLAAPYARRLLSKTSAAASPDTTGSSATTSGELERELSAGDVSGRVTALPWQRVEPDFWQRRRGRGVPEWVKAIATMSADEKRRL